MSSRPRFAAAGLVLAGILVFSLLGAVSSGASEKARGKVSVHLTKTSFTVAQARTVKLVCKFSPTSKHFNYQLSFRRGSAWVNVRRVNRRGSFKGTYSMTVKSLFGLKPVKAGKYRLKVSADANIVTRSLRITGGSGNSDGGTNTTPTATGPKSGLWQNDKIGYDNRVSFYVEPTQKNVWHVEYWYSYSGGSAACSGNSAIGTPLAGRFSMIPIWTDGRFLVSYATSETGSSFTFSGTFDSPTRAHGTARVIWRTDLCYFDSTDVPWTASWKRAGKPG